MNVTLVIFHITLDEVLPSLYRHRGRDLGTDGASCRGPLSTTRLLISLFVQSLTTLDA